MQEPDNASIAALIKDAITAIAETHAGGVLAAAYLASENAAPALNYIVPSDFGRAYPAPPGFFETPTHKETKMDGLDEALKKANEHMARINGARELNPATWEEQQAAEAAENKDSDKPDDAPPVA